MDAKSLGPIMRRWRIEAKLSQAELGQEAGLSRKVIAGIENGTRKFDQNQIVLLCRVLDRTVDQLTQTWSQALLETLRAAEREMEDPADRAPEPTPAAPAAVPQPEPALSPALEKAIDKMTDQFRNQFRDVFEISQKELLSTVEKMIAQAAAFAPPSSTLPQRARSRVSRKGRVKPPANPQR
ncbi:MAG TPA: helix-turn-helix transcriptional regulator [Thermoanaerobaculia bacterium]|nr:helix-turn-helix transcriptional regulator [Thermoanaerobaculia bacterium]